MPLEKNHIFLFRRDGCFGGPNDPAKCSNHQQAEEQSEPTHETRPGYSRAVLGSREIIYYDVNIFLVRSYKNSTLPPTESKRFSSRILRRKVASPARNHSPAT